MMNSRSHVRASTRPRATASTTPRAGSADTTFASLVENLLRPRTTQDEWAQAVRHLTTRHP
jgi:hypothetical protein